MAAPFPSSSSMDSWPQRRGLQTMNLRSVFTVEQQMILERYYDNGMTNQSKACFQLILQCAQEAKLDFSVVRTWVGNKRRKLASKGDQNGGMTHPLPSHGLAGGLLSSHTLSGGALSNHGLSVAALLPSEITAVRNIHNRAHLLPTSTSFPSFSSSSSSASSPSPLSSTNNNNNSDIIHTSIYSNPRLQPKLTGPLRSESEVSALPPCSLISQAVQTKTNSSSSSLHSKLVSLSHNLPPLTSASASLVFTAGRDMKTTLSLKEVGLTGGVRVAGLPPSWSRPFGNAQTQPWSASPQSQAQLQPRAETNPQEPPAAPHKTRLSLPLKNLNPTSEQTSGSQQVFISVERGEGIRIKPGLGCTLKGHEIQRPVSRTLDTIYNFSIAMETADEEDEWLREEELANMAAQNNMHQEQTPSLAKGSQSMTTTSSQNLLLDSNSAQQGSSSFTQTSIFGEASSQTPISAATWVISNSRKRTLQDRTQFSDGDIIQLKRYWDRGMTSLGSVCREKITAAANQLNVDTEIVKTWISNRRRKYRLMGIEIPPPKGGPAVFTNTSSPRGESPVAFSPEDRLRTPELGDDLNDGVSLCLSEDSTIDSQHRDENGTVVTVAAPLANNVKIEVIDGDVEDDDNEGEIVPLDLEQMQSLLEFKHEEVQFLENELENQKQKYLDLASFTKRLLSAVRNKDVEKQQELIASLPQPLDQVWDMTKDRGTLPDVVSEEKSSNYHITMTNSVECMQEPENEGSPRMNIKEHRCIKVTEPSASEEQMQGVQEHE
ncbi:highly divergent homeobox [Syngnathoides biaculeatus]|uniref:highly divergent homeobox n=1 Tax=Syngnathoides biaculeatus TaxID=300417 RepID=UPI002ADDC96E|nr:highly divergent homeobox [Syngnathoides biaculeatus]XP_061690461.1 highly divergent homeobox [Syngnathoides biaculeatus]XP_061690462.1 highly divergent homeobox [Syngnathoides biaculeatus]